MISHGEDAHKSPGACCRIWRCPTRSICFSRTVQLQSKSLDLGALEAILLVCYFRAMFTSPGTIPAGDKTLGNAQLSTLGSTGKALDAFES